VLAAAGTCLSCRAAIQWKVGHLARDHPQVLYRVETRAKAVALTIDDGPDATTTPEILRVLERNGAHATFFIISGRVPGNEGLLRRMVTDGSGYACSAVESAFRMASISSRSTTAVPIPSQAVTIQLSSKDTCTRRTCG